MANNYADLSTSTVATAPSPATTGTSLVVQSGHGARFPAVPFYATIHPEGTHNNVQPTIILNKIIK